MMSGFVLGVSNAQFGLLGPCWYVKRMRKSSGETAGHPNDHRHSSHYKNAQALVRLHTLYCERHYDQTPKASPSKLAQIRKGPI